MNRKLTTLLIALLLSVSFLTAAFAEDKDDEDAKPTFFGDEVVVTAERTDEGLSKTARNISIVTGDEIYQRIARTVPESLRYEAGVSVQRTNLGGGAPFIRGMVGNQILYMVDGIRMNNSTYRGGPNQYLNTLDPFFIDRVEVVRGPGSVLYGSDALGGVINVITKRRTDFSKKYAIDGDLMGRASSADLEQTGHIGLETNASDVFGMVGSATFRKFGDVDPGGGNLPLQTPYDYEEQDFAGNFDFHFGNHVDWELGAQFVNLDDVHNYDPNNPKNIFEPQRRQLFYSKLKLNDLSEYLDRITLFGSMHNQTEGRIRRPAVTPPDPATETRDLDIVQTLAGGLQMESPIGKWVRFVYGGEYYTDEVLSERETEDLATGNEQTVDPQFPDGSTYSTAAGYLEVRVTPVDWLKLVPGVRYSAFIPDIEMEDPQIGKVTVDDTISDLTWAFHSLFFFAKHHGIVAGVAKGFRAPGIDDLTKLGSEDGRFDIPNSELDPETMIQYEMGYRITHPNVYLSLFGYYSQIQDLIVRKESTYNGQSTIGQDVVNQNQNVGEAYNYGSEFSFKVTLFDNFYNGGLNASYTFGHNETDDEPLRRIPPVTGNIWSRITFEPVWFEWLMEGALEQDRLSQGDIDDSRIGPDGTPAFDIHHLRFGLEPADWVQGILAVENVTDEEYKYHGSGVYEAGRNYKMQLRLMF